MIKIYIFIDVDTLIRLSVITLKKYYIVLLGLLHILYIFIIYMYFLFLGKKISH